MRPVRRASRSRLSLSDLADLDSMEKEVEVGNASRTNVYVRGGVCGGVWR